MFRAQQNAFDDAVAKATDENLTSENWEYILVRVSGRLAFTVTIEPCEADLVVLRYRMSVIRFLSKKQAQKKRLLP
jgi:hypothetical protein